MDYFNITFLIATMFSTPLLCQKNISFHFSTTLITPRTWQKYINLHSRLGHTKKGNIFFSVASSCTTA